MKPTYPNAQESEKDIKHFTRHSSHAPRPSKMHLGLIIACLACLSLTASAQAPGYLGHRVSVMYQPQFMVWFRPTRFSLAHTAILQFAANEKNLLEFRYSYSKATRDFNPSNLNEEDDYSYYYYTSEAEATTHSAAFFVKVFQKRRGFIAPAGAYWSFGAGLLISKAVFTEENDLYPVGETAVSYNDGAFYIGRGRQFIFADRIILDLGCQAGIAVKSLAKVGYDLHHEVFFANLFRVNIGLGFIAF